jgi:hypothetical protein
MLTTWYPLSAKSWQYLRRQEAALGQYSSLSDSGHGVCFFLILCPAVERFALCMMKHGLNAAV